MAKRISNLEPGENVRVKFHGSKRFGNEPYELDLIFKGVAGSGDDARATFDYGDGTEFECYRDRGHWAYGMSSEKLSLVA